jgi:hypothetical protein
VSVTLDYTETLVVTSCWCGIALAIPANLHSYARNHANYNVYCPLGHTFVYRDTYEEQLKQERRRHEATRDLLAHEERSHSATKGQLTKARKRAAAGVCPCCQRTFQNVARHVKTKHPEFDPAATP